MKFEQNWLRGFRGEVVCGRTDGRKVITIAHPEHSSGELKTIYPHCIISCRLHGLSEEDFF